MREPSGSWISAQDIETARAILAKAKQETKNQNSFRGSRVGSFRSKNESMYGKRRLSYANSSVRKPRSSGTLNHFDQSSAGTRASSSLRPQLATGLMTGFGMALVYHNFRN